jgi:outer membrane receptor protein involved in Fe transport
MKKVRLYGLLLLLLICHVVMAGTTGKIAGSVTNKETGEAIVGVNVMIVGTALGGVTDLEGRFTILNVPVGAHEVRFSCLGFQSQLQQNIWVNIDLTTTLNIKMVSTTLSLGEEVVIVAERPLIRKDETNTNIIRTEDEIKSMPVRGVQELASVTAGVIKQDNSAAMNVRGGRSNETATYIDGVMVTDPYNAAMRLYIPTKAIEEISVQTGGFNAEYGEAMSGILAVTTRAGKDRYSFSLEAVTDEFLSPSSKNLGTYSYGFNEYVASASGPLWPKKQHTFFASVTRNYQADWTPSWGWAENPYKLNTYTYNQPLTSTLRNASGQFLVDTLQHNYKFNARLPGNASSDWSYTGKIKLQLAKQVELKASLIQTDRTFSSDWFGTAVGIQPVQFFNTGHRPLMDTHSRSVNVTLTQLLSTRTFYDLKLNLFDTGRKVYDATFKDDLYKYGDPRYNPWPDSSIYLGEAYTGRISPDFFQPGAQYDAYCKQRSQHWGIDFDITHQMGKYHNFKAGFEYKYHTLRYYQLSTPSRLADPDWATDIEKYRGADVRMYGYDLEGNEVDSGDYLTDVVRDADGRPISGFKNQKPYHPIIMNGYVQDKIEFEDLILNLGLRWDYIDPNAWMFKQLAAGFNSDGSVIAGTGMFGGDQIFDSRDVKKSEAYYYFSPRLGIGFPVTDKTVFHAQFGKFYQAPPLQDLYLSPFYMDSYVSSQGYFTWLNNPNIRPPKTTSYEIGFKQTLSDFASLQLTAFYKETEDLIQLVPITTDVKTIAFRENGDFGTIKGLDLIFTLRRFKNLSAQLNYELQFADGTGSASNSNYDIAWQRGTRGSYPKFTMPLDFEQRHTGSLNIDYRFSKADAPKLLRNFGVNMVFAFNSGNPYTRMALSGQFPFSGRYDNNNLSQIPATSVNVETTPWMYKIDMRVDKQIEMLNSKFTFYAWIINLLNTENIQEVWWTSGLADDTGYLRTSAGRQYWNSITETTKQLYKMREIDYNNYGVPRQIRLGVQWEI